MPQNDVSRSEDLPEPSPELVLLRVLVEAHIATLPSRKAMRFLKEIARLLGEQEARMDVLEFRPPNDRAAVVDARRKAFAWYRQCLSGWFKRLDGA